MARLRLAFVLAIALAAAGGEARAQDLVPPQVGFTIKFRFAASQGEPNPDNTFRVAAVDGLRSTAEVEIASTPPERYTLHSYRVWYSERVARPRGTLFQDSPTALIDDFAVLKPGLTRVFPAKLRYEADPSVATLPDGEPNRSNSFDLDMTYTVERTERVSVPAGEFDTFVLARTQAFIDRGTVARRDTTRIWYAPALRWWVKIENTSTAPGVPVATGVAIEVKRP